MYIHSMAANETQGDAAMQTIAITEITDAGRDDTLAAIEELTTSGALTSTDGDELTITDGYGSTLTPPQAIAELRDYLAA